MQKKASTRGETSRILWALAGGEAVPEGVSPSSNQCATLPTLCKGAFSLSGHCHAFGCPSLFLFIDDKILAAPIVAGLTRLCFVRYAHRDVYSPDPNELRHREAEKRRRLAAREQAATMIQARVRGYRARVRQPLLFPASGESRL
eukprot:COSAG04_NODE_646_length_11599_cov_28.808435_9_plen_145_part_00